MPRRSKTQNAALTKPKPIVILVDDDLLILRALRRLLVSSGFSVRAFPSGSALLSSAIPKANACLILDVYLPDTNGPALYEELVASGCRLPVVLMTGQVDDATRTLVARIPGAPLLSKPFSRELLVAEIAQALASSHKTS